MELKPSAITKLFETSNFVIDDKVYFSAFVISIAKSVYGITPESVDKFLIDLCYNEICSKYKNLTESDLAIAFGKVEVTEKIYVLSKNEILGPINEFVRKKNIVKIEIEKQLEIEREQAETQRQAREFYQQAKQCYMDSLKAGKWLGDEFQANAIGPNFSGQLNPEEMAEINKKAKYEYTQRKESDDPFTAATVPSWQKIYARMYVEIMIQKRKLFIEI